MARAQPKVRIGANVRRLRSERGWTQSELSAMADIADATLSRIERGRMSASVALAERIARALGAKLDDLVGPAPRLDPKALRPGEARMLALFRTLDDASVEDLAKCLGLLFAVRRRSLDQPSATRRVRAGSRTAK